MSVDLTSVSDEELFAEVRRRSNLVSDAFSYVTFSAEEDILPVLEEEFKELSHLSEAELKDVSNMIVILMRSKFEDRLTSTGNEMIPALISYNLEEALNRLDLSRSTPTP